MVLGAVAQGKEWLCYRRQSKTGDSFLAALLLEPFVRCDSLGPLFLMGLRPLSVFSIRTEVILLSLGWAFYFSLLLCGQELSVTCLMPGYWEQPWLKLPLSIKG